MIATPAQSTVVGSFRVLLQQMGVAQALGLCTGFKLNHEIHAQYPRRLHVVECTV